jgi:hypothetical protein
MVINFVLGGLCIFTDTRSDEAGKGQYIKEQVLIRIACVR